jgi:glutathione transport system permease protein
MVNLWHALRNAMIPILTVTGLQFGFLLGGTVVIESVFAWPGLGRLLVEAVDGRDYPVIQTLMLFFSLQFVAINLVVDLLYAAIDPRISYE